MINELKNLMNIIETSNNGNALAHSSTLKTIIGRLLAIINISSQSYDNIKFVYNQFHTNVNKLRSKSFSIVDVKFLKEPTILINSNINKIHEINSYIEKTSSIKFKLESNNFIINSEYLNTMNNVFVFLSNHNEKMLTKVLEIYYHLKIEAPFLNRPRVLSENNMNSSKSYFENVKNEINILLNNLNKNWGKKSLFDIDFIPIERQLKDHLTQLSKVIESQLRRIKRVSTNRLFSLSQDKYYIPNFPNYPATGKITHDSFRNVISNLNKKYGNKGSSFSSSINFSYNNLSRNIFIPQIFSALYENILNAKQSLAVPSNLNEYYNVDIVTKYRESNLIDKFIKFYAPLYNTSKLMTEQKLNVYSIPANDGFSNMKEGFSSERTNDVTAFPDTPQYLNICTTVGTAQGLNLIENGFLYGDDKKNFDSYIYDMFGDHYVKNDNHHYECNNTADNSITPQVKYTYSVMDTLDTTVKRSLNTNIFKPKCEVNKNVCDIDSFFVLNYTSTGGNTVDGVKIDINYNRSSYSHDLTAKLSLANVLVGDLDVIPTSGSFNDDSYDDLIVDGKTYKRKFKTNVSASVATSYELLTKVEPGEESNENLDGNKALYSQDGKLRLIINSDGNLVLQYKLKIKNKIINNKAFLGYGIGSTENEQSVFISQLKDKDKNKVGTHVNKIGYLSVNNKFKSYGEDSKIYSGSDLGYKKYNKLAIKLDEEDRSTISESDCNSDLDCIGYLNNSSGGSDTKYKISKEKRNKIYYTGDNTDGKSIFLKNLGLKLNEKISLANTSDSYHEMGSSGRFDNLLNNTGPLELPTIEHILKPNYDSLKTSRNTMNTNYSHLVDSFNQLTENELVMLNEAGISVKELKKLTTRYSELYNDMSNKARLKDLFDSQKHDSSQLYNKSEYTMALTGIASIASLMYVFNYMKK